MGFEPSPNLWFTKDKQYFEATEERCLKMKESLLQAEVLVITLGLSEVWFDTIFNEPMWRSIPESLYEQDRHVFKLATVEETLGTLIKFDSLITENLPQLKIILTLSPIPLLATFRNQSAVTANQVSKAILRVALDQFMSVMKANSSSRYYYFPSYEMVFNLFENPFESDNRHIKKDVANYIL